jgi:hypothetical protein
MNRRLKQAVSLILLTGAWARPAIAQGKLKNFEDFATSTGRCSQSDLDSLKEFQEGFTYSVKPAEVLSNSGIAPQGVGTIPPLISLTCHGKSCDRDLWLVSRTEDPAYCGWVKSDTLLKSKSKRGALSKLDIFNRSKNEGVCGDIAPLTVGEYCATMKQLGSNIEACDDERLRGSSINAKFLIWNAGLTAQERTINALEVPVYATPEATEVVKSVSIFSVLRIFDIVRNDKGTFFLVGSSHRNMIGWVKEDSGTVWYTVLSTFFSMDGETEIRSDDPRAPDAITLGIRPDNLAEMLEGHSEFARYPVLFDRRRPPKGREKVWVPHLEIAFIGMFCGKRQLCAEELGHSGPNLPVEINKSDVIFLIDATKSMKVYFDLVSRAVRNVVTEDYIGSPDFQFGVALYGDHLHLNAVGLNDPLQFKMPIRLQPLTRGDEFDRLAHESLYIDDPVGGFEEAPFAALAKVARETPWRGDIPRFIIHIADDGDRGPPPQELLDVLRQQRIFYIPIAVRGDYHKDYKKYHAQLVSQMQDILKRHVTPSGQTIGLPKVLKTYATEDSPEAPKSEYDAIASALRGGISLGPELKKSVLQALLKVKEGEARPNVGDANLLPPGYSSLTKAAMELFGIDIDRDSGNAAQRIVAMKGYIETAPLRAEQDRWRYYAAISPGDISQLKSSFDVSCKTVDETDAADQFIASLKRILTVLTGDRFESDDQLRNYFRDRDSIPLSSRTILGDGLIELAQVLINPNSGPRVKALQKEACRTALLMQRIDGRQRLRRPFEKQVVQGKVVSGDLEWDDHAGLYHYKNAEQHDWVYQDKLGNKTVYVPLDYLPSPPEKIR